MTDYKDIIIKELDVLRRISVTESAGIFKSRVYTAAIKTLTALPHVRSVADLPEMTKGDGLGKEVRIKIAKIIENGGLEINPKARDLAVALEQIQGIYGVGPKKAQDLVAEGYTSIAGLRAAVASDPGILNKNQHIGLRYYEQLLQRIPRSEMDQHAALLMAAKPAALEGVIVGSYRRRKPDSGDIDMLIRTAKKDVDAGAALNEFVEKLKASGYIREVLAHGEHKCMAICQLPSSPVGRRLDLLVTPPEEFPFAVFYFTGSDTFNVRVRALAQEKGFTLNEHALTHVRLGKPVKGIRDERTIFSVLNIEWREPHERTGPDAVVAIQKS
jgi:DNA polymerase/3'-5' exonuclease PolX